MSVSPAEKAASAASFFRAFHLSVQQADPQVREDGLLQRLRPGLGGAEDPVLALLHGGADDIDLMALAALPADEAVQPLAQRLAHEEGLDRPAAGRQLADDGHVQVAVGDQRQRARDGRGGHDEQMRAAALLGELRPLGHAEAVLLVGHNEAEVAEHNGLTQKRVRADDQLRLAGGELLARGALLRGSSGAGQQQHAHTERPEQLRECPRVLLGQNFRGGP